MYTYIRIAVLSFPGKNPTLLQQLSPDPHFRYIQAQNKRIVLILDVSGSMVYNQTKGVSRFSLLNKTA